MLDPLLQLCYPYLHIFLFLLPTFAVLRPAIFLTLPTLSQFGTSHLLYLMLQLAQPHLFVVLFSNKYIQDISSDLHHICRQSNVAVLYQQSIAHAPWHTFFPWFFSLNYISYCHKSQQISNRGSLIIIIPVYYMYINSSYCTTALFVKALLLCHVFYYSVEVCIVIHSCFYLANIFVAQFWFWLLFELCSGIYQYSPCKNK